VSKQYKVSDLFGVYNSHWFFLLTFPPVREK
jgi:hypothetical protein